MQTKKELPMKLRTRFKTAREQNSGRKRILMKSAIAFSFACLISLGLATEARAIAHTYVSAATGNDANLCTLNAPCRTFNAAVPKTNAKGELTALDSGTYGNIQIDRALTIQAAPGVYAAVGDETKLGVAITINAPAGARIVLSRLYITSRIMGRGIDFISGSSLHVENCVISGFKDYGIRFNLEIGECDSGCPKLSLKDNFVRGNEIGIGVKAAMATIEHTRVEDNATGVQIKGESKVTLRDSVLAMNSSDGVTLAFLSTGRIENCAVTDNGTGLNVISDATSPGSFYVSDTIVSGNNIGLRADANGLIAGKIYSFGNNRLFGNTTDGSFTQQIQPQ